MIDFESYFDSPHTSPALDDPTALLREMVADGLCVLPDASEGIYLLRKETESLARPSVVSPLATRWLIGLGLVEACAGEDETLYVPTAEGRRVGRRLQQVI